MSAASDLIERAERETGCRVDADDGNNAAITFLVGALTRELGLAPHCGPHDDFVVGVVSQHRMSADYAAQQTVRAMLGNLLALGISPDVLRALSHKRNDN